MFTLKFLKDWKGEVSVAPEAKLQDLLNALQQASSIEPSTCASMIVRGKKIDLASAEMSLSISSMGITNGTAIMLVKHSDQTLKMMEQERRMSKLGEVEATARMISERVSPPLDPNPPSPRAQARTLTRMLLQARPATEAMAWSCRSPIKMAQRWSCQRPIAGR